MKKEWIIFSLMILLCIGSVNSALDISLERSSYCKGESFLADINLKNKPLRDLSLSDISVLDRYGRHMTIGLYLIKFNDNKYYAYFEVPDLMKENYKFYVDNYLFIENNQIKEENNFTSFSVGSCTGNVLNVDPRAIKLDLNKKNNFILRFRNNGDNLININLNGKGTFSKSIFELTGKTSKDITVNYNGSGDDIINAKYGNLSYNIYVSLIGIKEEIKIIKNETVIENQTVPVEEEPVEVLPIEKEEVPKDSLKFGDEYKEIVLELNQDEKREGHLTLKNFYNGSLYNISIGSTNNLNEIILIEPIFIKEISAFDSKSILVVINKDENLDQDYSGEIVVTSAEETFVSLPISVALFKTENETIQEENITIEEKINETKETIPEFGEEKKGHGWIWFVVVLTIIIAGITGFVIFKSRKLGTKEEDLGELMEKVEK